MGSSSNPHIELFGSVVELELEPEEPILFETWSLAKIMDKGGTESEPEPKKIIILAL